MSTRTLVPVVLVVSLLSSGFNRLSAASPPRPTAVDSAATAAYAWSLFVQATAPSGNAQRPLTFENWKEQCEIQPALCGLSASAVKASAKNRVRRAHGSPLRAALTGKQVSSPVGCNSMFTAGFPPNAPATNVSPNAVFCEEVFVNQAESTFITTNHLTTIAGQQKFGNVTFPWSAIEVKVDWVPQSSFVTPFSCTDPTLYIETIQFEGQPSQCYALVGMHISSKVLPDWLWGTFEPNSKTTNPNRCNGNLYSLCFDPWGTTSATPYGSPSAHPRTPPQSAALARLMTSKALPKAFNNYYLTGAQTLFVQNGQPTQLGNSFVEFNAQVSPHQASCITCHRYAYAGTTNVGFPLNGWPNIGYACNSPNPTKNCLPPPKTAWTSEDFSWLLGIMPAK